MFIETTNQKIARAVVALRNRHFFVLDLLVLSFIPLVALMLRTDDALGSNYTSSLVVYTLVSVVLWVLVFVLTRVYSHYWQYASVEELVAVVQAVLWGTLLNIFVFFALLRPFNLISDGFPRSMPFLVSLLTLIAMIGTRSSVRFFDRQRHTRRATPEETRQVAVFGAGESGVMIARELQQNPQLGMTPVAFLDDDVRKHNSVIKNIPVVGGRDMLVRLAREGVIAQVIVAMPTASGKTLREIAALCQQEKVRVQTVPGMFELLNGTVSINKLRNIEIEDLLRREPIVTERTASCELLRGKRVLVTGAGGSIGGELCRQIALCEPAQLVLLGHGENSIFVQTNELRAAFPELDCVPVIADVRDAPRLNAVMARCRPELVFHAAAHKHVSLMESNLEDAVTNNVLGTRTVLDASHAHGVETFVMISTDKAVNPESIMGVTKRVAELYVHARALETKRRYIAVRFGNVLGSRGSVVPLFKQQIANGGPVQVTHPDVRRFFMTIPEAVQLVLQAAMLGHGGEIFALDMGEPIRIVDLAHDLIRLSGLQVGRDIDIEFIGLRPGEKLYEELFVPGELYEPTAREKIFIARNGLVPPPDANARLYAAIDKLGAAAQQGNTERARDLLAMLVPEFKKSAIGNSAGVISDF